MTHSQINCFLLVAKNMSFSKTASELSITQPAVSRLISQLETELGFQLFDRVQKGVQLTASGRIMADFFLRYQKELAHTMEEARLAGQGYTSVIRIGCRDAWDIANFYPPMEAFFAKKFPNLKLVIDGYDSSSMIKALKQGDVDVVISSMSHLLDDPEITSRKLTSIGSHLLFSRSHPLADRRNLQLLDFKDMPFFTINEPEGPRNTSKLIRSYCRAQGFEPKIVNLPSLTAELIKVQSGEGVVLTDDWMIVKSSYLFKSISTDLICDIGVGWLEDGRESLRYLFVKELLFFYQNAAGRPAPLADRF
jgi:DNA-binding transcriptional LysR family regulator